MAVAGSTINRGQISHDLGRGRNSQHACMERRCGNVLTQMPIPHPTSNILFRDVSFYAETPRREASLPEDSARWVLGRAFCRTVTAINDD